jgi:2-polyprenyl-3-methyl-5-hydroxy-6-metoxy-1,4-benzoquinol methylase
MANPEQQKETLAYFRSHATEWSGKARENSPTKINVVHQRNDYALHIVRQRQTTALALDVGCGTGDLVLDLAKMGVRGVGVDFAPEMIELATERATQENLGLAQFDCGSIFDFDMGNGTYDCIVANGFIEYITVEQLIEFISMTYQALNKDGSLVLGSRNRLFNLFSQNGFTEQEIEAKTILPLLNESKAIMRSASFDELLSLDSLPLPTQDQEQVQTTIEVSLRLQYTPSQLMKLLHNVGYETVDIYPIHIHGIVPQIKDLYPKIHVEVANQLQEQALDHQELVAQASSFMIHAKKAG